MQFSNFHTHTTYCDGNNTPEQMVKSAIRLGCKQLGFSGHSYTAFDESYCMSQWGTKQYEAEIHHLQQIYQEEIEIFFGVEQDYYSTSSTAEYDYVIGAVHYVKKGKEYLPIDESAQTQLQIVNTYYGGDYYAFAKDYYYTLANVYEKTHCNIVAHFDLITKFNENGKLFDETDKRYLTAAFDALDALCKQPVVFEVNTGAMARGWRTVPYPAFHILTEMKRRKLPIILSSDAHNSKNLLYGFESIYSQLQSAQHIILHDMKQILFSSNRSYHFKGAKGEMLF